MTLGLLLISLILKLISFILWTLLFFLFALWWSQGYIVYLPTTGGRSGLRRKLSYNPFTSRSPAEQDIPYEEFFLVTSDNVTIHSWLLRAQPPRRGQQQSTSSTRSIQVTDSSIDTTNGNGKPSIPTIIFFHGNAGNIGNRIYNAQSLITTCQANVFLVEYRGYGNSSGVPSEHGFQLDALCALDFIRHHDNIDPRTIYIFGRSLGGAVAIWLAAQRPQHIAGLMIENTFTSLSAMARTLLDRFLPQSMDWVRNETVQNGLKIFLFCFMTSQWRSIDAISEVQCPILFLSGLNDALIPPLQMQKLRQRVNPNVYCHFHTIPDGTHNDSYIRGGASYFEVIKRFLYTSSIAMRQHQQQLQQQQQQQLVNNNNNQQQQHSGSATHHSPSFRPTPGQQVPSWAAETEYSQD